MQRALEARARKETHGFRPFPVQSGIYHVLSLPSLAGTVIGPAALIETASVSTVRSISKAHTVTERLSVESVREAVASSLSDCDAVPSLAAACSEASEQVNCKVVDADVGRRPHAKATLEAGTEECEVFECEEVSKRKSDGESRPPQMRSPPSACIKTSDWRRQQDQQEIEGSQHRDRGEGRALVACRSSDRAGPSSASKPAQTRLETGRKSFGEMDQGIGELSNGKSPKRRRRRRRKVKRHPDRWGYHDATRKLRDKTDRGHRSRGHADHATHEKSHHRISGGRHSFLQSLRRTIRGVSRLFCL